MASYERSYSTARAVFSFLEIAGWIVVVFGVIIVAFSLRDFNADILIGAAQIEIPVIIRLYSVIIGVSVAINGLLIIAFVQNFRSNIDVVENTRDLLNIARDYSSSVVKKAEPVVKCSNPVSSDCPVEPGRYRGSYMGSDIFVALVAGEEWFFVEENKFKSFAAAKAFIDEERWAPSMFGKIPVPDLPKPRPDKGEDRLAENFMGVEIFQKHDGHYIKNKWFANLDAAKAFVKKVLNEEAKSKTQNDENQ